MLPCFSTPSTGATPYPCEDSESRCISSDPDCEGDDVAVLAEVDNDEARKDEAWKRRRENETEAVNVVTA